jgi:hypothetical protein
MMFDYIAKLNGIIVVVAWTCPLFSLNLAQTRPVSNLTHGHNFKRNFVVHGPSSDN